jgi:hypothetical protein
MSNNRPRKWERKTEKTEFDTLFSRLMGVEMAAEEFCQLPHSFIYDICSLYRLYAAPGAIANYVGWLEGWCRLPHKRRGDTCRFELLPFRVVIFDMQKGRYLYDLGRQMAEKRERRIIEAVLGHKLEEL